MLTHYNWRNLLEQGFELTSSGTTGPAKTIYQSPAKLAAANRIALEAQGISRSSRVLTVCRMSHAGGVLAQTLPALSIGAHVAIKPFNAYSLLRDVAGFTHTHLTPEHCALLMKTRSFTEAELSGLFIACGSDRVSFDVIAAFVARGAVFMCNWGMTEIGPITINTVFDSMAKVEAYRQHALSNASLLGDRFYCDYKIVDGVLWVKGDCCVYDHWFATGDRVQLTDTGALYYLGRVSL